MSALDPDTFIARWAGADGSELANYQLFVGDLCRLLDVPLPGPAREDTRDNAYVFERRVQFAHGDGSTSTGRIDCYKRGAFVLEAKKVKLGQHTRGFDDALLRARAQAEGYARALPAAEGRPPFLVVVDVGQVIELYAEFTKSGATYTPFPDARSHRLKLVDLRNEAVRQRPRALWLDPMALDPARASAKVTREVAVQLANLARSLDAAGHGAEKSAAFLTRCLFSMFAEDVGLLPQDDRGEGAFTGLIQRWRDDPGTLQKMLAVLWADMDRGGFSAALARDVLRFNGKLFKGWQASDFVLPLTREQIDLLLVAARSNWREVEPAIFGTLLEWALDPVERHALGAHYTPRAYVERLVLPAVVEPLRQDWANAQAAALLLCNEANGLEGKKRDDKLAEARAELRRFHRQLCTVRVLDPACGSGNFLYVTLEHLKRLEGEVLVQIEALGDTQGRLGLEGEAVTPRQLLGIEINERATALAELVLWIGYLQWHIRTFGHAAVAEPVIHDYRNIEHRDAVLAYDRVEYETDASGRPVMRWDGRTMKKHPVTGLDVPDESAQVPVEKYVNPRAAEWPAADFVIGNPPFIGASTVRRTLGEGYANALRSVWRDVPESADFVMHWWHRAAALTSAGKLRRFGLITTNSLPQAFNRRVVEAALESGNPVHLVFAIADHPWVNNAQGAAVRISMTVGAAGRGEGELCAVTGESATEDGSSVTTLARMKGTVHADLRIGANVAASAALAANAGVSSPGMKLHGSGFIVSAEEATVLGRGSTAGLEAHIRPYMNGRDLTDRPRGALVIDLFGLGAEEVRERFPAVYQWVSDRVRPERMAKEHTADGRGYARLWWLHGKPRPVLRTALEGLPRYIATVETAKHRTFQFLDGDIAPDNMLIAIALNAAASLGVLSSRLHVTWALATGGTLEDRPRYNKSRCFETFPFPVIDTAASARIAALAEQIDTHRKRQQAAHPGLTLTGLYNVLEKLRHGEPLTAKEKVIHDHGLVSVLRELHDELDRAVFDAYGWGDLAAALVGRPGATTPWPEKPAEQAAAEEELLSRLVALNAERAAEEARGLVRWLRPEFQARPQAGEQASLDTGPGTEDDSPLVPAAAAPAAKRPWPGGLPEQMKAVAEVLAGAARPLTQADIEAHFSARGRWRERLPDILDTLAALGRARELQGAPALWTAA